MYDVHIVSFSDMPPLVDFATDFTLVCKNKVCTSMIDALLLGSTYSVIF